VTSAIGTVRSRIAVLFTVFCTKSAHGFFTPHGTTLRVVLDRETRSVFRGLHAPGNMTDNYRVDGRGYQSDFTGDGIGEIIRKKRRK
ncbi:hypothetical protein, partial [Methanoculleus sp. UBA300]|uniref:hypothetical protein n=1 Tax=Methanoculleus sp. UBA300 TaxID=1915496 RepID=UPI00319DC349